MAVTSKPRSLWSSRLHFIVRFLGLTGLLAAGVGIFLAILNGLTTISFTKMREDGGISAEPFVQQVQVIREAIAEQKGLLPQITAWLVVAGSAAFLVALLVELLVMVRTTAGRRSAFGLNMVVQCALAIVLLVGINYFSFEHFKTFDWTRDQRFTLDKDIQDQLRSLTGETTLVVYKRHKTFGALNDKPDEYDYEAERKVVEKVNDLVSQFRQFGGQFNVEVLDVEEKGFDRKRDEFVQKAPELKGALEEAPENSIFFYAKEKGQKGKVQRLSFNQFYQLDKNASKKAGEGKGNLVLRNQGVWPFARRALNIDDRKPTVGIAVVHESLTTRGAEESITLAGLRKALIEQGFNVEDIVLKKWSQTGPEPEVATFEEFKDQDLEEVMADLDVAIKSLEAALKEDTEFRDHLKTASLKDLTKEFAKQLRGKEVTEEIRREQVAFRDQVVARDQAILDNLRQQREESAKEKAGLSPDSSGEQRRLTDLRAKFTRLLAKCDLLIVPRVTIFNLSQGEFIAPSLHNIDKAQADAIKDFMKAGKPVLVCFGPTSDPPNNRFAMEDKGSDALEEMLTELGFRFNKQTILFNEEAKAFTQRRGNILNSRSNVQVPVVKFDWPAEGKDPNPIRSSLMVSQASLGQDLDIRIRTPRPISFDSDAAKKLPYEPDFMRTADGSWSDDNPFPTRERTPHPEPTKPGDPLYDTTNAKRLGPFSIGVAAELPVPATWYSDGVGASKTVRIAAIGQGHWFVGPDLSPAKQRVLLDTCNWLLGRNDELLGQGTEWQYPRVQLSAVDLQLWRWGTQLGLPMIFAYLGLVVWMVRRLR